MHACKVPPDATKNELLSGVRLEKFSSAQRLVLSGEYVKLQSPDVDVFLARRLPTLPHLTALSIHGLRMPSVLALSLVQVRSSSSWEGCTAEPCRETTHALVFLD